MDLQQHGYQRNVFDEIVFNTKCVGVKLYDNYLTRLLEEGVIKVRR